MEEYDLLGDLTEIKQVKRGQRKKHPDIPHLDAQIVLSDLVSDKKIRPPVTEDEIARFTPEIQEIIRLWHDGNTLSEIAAALGKTRGVVGLILCELGFQTKETR